MTRFTATIKRFEKKGEKTGWSYIEISADLAQKLKSGNRKEFKVKGKIDNHPIRQVSLLPMGEGSFIMPLNSTIRKAIGKQQGATVIMDLAEDRSEFVLNKDFMDCLADEPAASSFFNTLPGSHQRYFSKWIDSAKTEPTKVTRIAQAVTALSKKQGYAEMMRSKKGKL